LPGKLRRHPLRFDAPQLLTLPDVFPPGMLNRFTGKAFSELWYRKSPTRQRQVQNITQFLHPLDMFGEWNRGGGARVGPQRAQAVRRGQPRAAVVPDAGLDAVPGLPDPPRARRAVRRAG